ncbi:hypothetical protein [Streptacidiphilus sp. EB129]|uniref:hypothetical protein n=1 Tax=Streptacidiphilus sp. EB129 TaxID=3156262 RepID=UPI003512FDA0
MNEAHEENDRRDVAQLLAAAGFRRATLGQFALTTASGFYVRTNRARTERCGSHQINILFKVRDYNPDQTALHANFCRRWSAAIADHGGWDVNYDAEYPEGGITVTRR